MKGKKVLLATLCAVALTSCCLVAGCGNGLDESEVSCEVVNVNMDEQSAVLKIANTSDQNISLPDVGNIELTVLDKDGNALGSDDAIYVDDIILPAQSEVYALGNFAIYDVDYALVTSGTATMNLDDATVLEGSGFDEASVDATVSDKILPDGFSAKVDLAYTGENEAVNGIREIMMAFDADGACVFCGWGTDEIGEDGCVSLETSYGMLKNVAQVECHFYPTIIRED